MTDFGKSIPLSELVPRKKIKDDTLHCYRKTVEKINMHLGVPNYTELYYEYFGKEETKAKIIELVPTLFTLNSPTAFTSKMAAIKSLLLSVPNLSGQAALVWSGKYNLPALEPKPTVELKRTWPQLSSWLLKIADDESKDSRLRIICHIYGAGLIVRTSVLVNTRLVDDGVNNFFDLENGIWNIRNTKTNCPQIIPLSDELRDNVKNIIHGREWMFHTCLLPKMNGEPYLGLSFNNFPPWAHEGLPGCNECRHTYETWNWSVNTMEQATANSKRLDHMPDTVADHYIKKKPKPVIKLRIRAQAAEPKPVEPSKPEHKSPYHCKACDKTYSHRSGLYRHLKTNEHKQAVNEMPTKYYYG